MRIQRNEYVTWLRLATTALLDLCIFRWSSHYAILRHRCSNVQQAVDNTAETDKEFLILLFQGGDHPIHAGTKYFRADADSFP